jgi:hypothetical protein
MDCFSRTAFFTSRDPNKVGTTTSPVSRISVEPVRRMVRSALDHAAWGKTTSKERPVVSRAPSSMRPGFLSCAKVSPSIKAHK